MNLARMKSVGSHWYTSESSDEEPERESVNTVVVMRKRPRRTPRTSDFALRNQAATELSDGVELDVEWLSIDPYLRGVMSGRHLGHRLEPDAVVPGLALARVRSSPDHVALAPGARVVADLGWRARAIAPLARLSPLGLPCDLPAQLALGVLGMPGFSAWVGLGLVALKPGDTLLVSAAAGTVGAVAGQLGRERGARVVGISSAAKCAYVCAQLGFDDCVDRNAPDFRERLAQVCRGGVDVVFDNVGGTVLDAALDHLARGARVLLCGMIDQYNRTTPPPGPNLGRIIAARASVHGMVVYDHWPRMPAFLDEAVPLVRDGRLVCDECVYQGLAQAPEAFCALMRGDTRGRVLVRVTEGTQ